MEWLVNKVMDFGMALFQWGWRWHERHNTRSYRVTERACRCMEQLEIIVLRRMDRCLGESSEAVTGKNGLYRAELN